MARDVHQGNDTFSPSYEFTHCDNYESKIVILRYYYALYIAKD